jgi:CheY-like chemotaxis protein
MSLPSQQKKKRASGTAAAITDAAPNVLVVEDVGVSQTMARTLLTLEHYRVALAASGAQAIELYQRHATTLELVLMDVGLPGGMDGVAATVAIRQQQQQQHALHHRLRIYGLTGKVEPADLERYRLAGMDGCIAKGCLLLDSVREALDQSSRGVAFVCLLPTSVAAAAAPSASPSLSSPITLLLVEDVRVSRRIALQSLQRAGVAVLAVETGAAAIEAFRRHADTLTVILMDINLPDMSGTDATQQIRAAASHQRQRLLIFGLTGNTAPDNLAYYAAAGMDGCIAKGGSVGQQLHMAVEQAIAQVTAAAAAAATSTTSAPFVLIGISSLSSSSPLRSAP